MTSERKDRARDILDKMRKQKNKRTEAWESQRTPGHLG